MRTFTETTFLSSIIIFSLTTTFFPRKWLTCLWLCDSLVTNSLLYSPFQKNDTVLSAPLFLLSFSPESSQSGFQPHYTTETVVTNLSKDMCLAKSYGPLPSSFCCVFQQYLARLTTLPFGNMSLSFHSLPFFCISCHVTSFSFPISFTLDVGIFQDSALDLHLHPLTLTSTFSPVISLETLAFNTIYILKTPNRLISPWISRFLNLPASLTGSLSSLLCISDLCGHNKTLAFLLPHGCSSRVFSVSINDIIILRTLWDLKHRNHSGCISFYCSFHLSTYLDRFSLKVFFKFDCVSWTALLKS